MNYSITNKDWNDAYNKQDNMHNTNDDVDFDDRVAHMHWACTFLFTLFDDHLTYTHGSSSERISPPSMVINMAHSLWLDLLRFLLLPLPPVCPRLHLPPRAVPWAPLHEGHGKPAPLRDERGWGHFWRLHHLHRFQTLRCDAEDRRRSRGWTWWFRWQSESRFRSENATPLSIVLPKDEVEADRAGNSSPPHTTHHTTPHHTTHHTHAHTQRTTTTELESTVKDRVGEDLRVPRGLDTVLKLTAGRSCKEQTYEIPWCNNHLTVGAVCC